ncbi:hypothetical protein Btru_069759 [Bulinus truncatus]|nr:hypothetical protein Btru_069759 [Bulinus truncatus]
MDYNMASYNFQGEYKPQQNYGVISEQNLGYNQQSIASSYQWGNNENVGKAVNSTVQTQDSTDYTYGYGSYTGGYEDYSAGYDYGYGNTFQEQWSESNPPGSYSQPYQTQTSEIDTTQSVPMPTYNTETFGGSNNGRGRGRGFDFGSGKSFGGDRGGSSVGRGAAMVDRGRGFGGNRGGGGRGSRGNMVGSNFSSRGRGKSERGGRGGGWGGSGMSRGGSGTGRGGPGNNARGGMGKNNRGNGNGSSRGFMGSSAGWGRGRGAARSETVVNKPLNQLESLSPYSSMATFIERWKTFALSFTDCGNAVSNIECSLKASKINLLQLNFDCKFLSKCSTYSVFTGVLNINKLSTNNMVLETIFIARGIGLSKKSAKMDCYEKAYKLLSHSTVQEIIHQKDCGEEFLIQEVQNIYKNNPKSFMEMLKKSNALAEMDVSKPSQLVKSVGANGGKSSGGGTNRKRLSNSRFAGADSKKGRYPDHMVDVLENKHLSLAPSKKIGILMHPNDSLFNKLSKLKELLKEEGITKLHIVPKIDQIAHKTAIHIQNVYRFQDVPILGFESRMPVYCEIYFDDIFMADGAPDFKRNVAMLNAYSSLASLLYLKPLEEIVLCPKVWRPFMYDDPDIYNVVTKWQGEDNNSLLTSNLANMKQMMQSMPDVTLPLEKMVLTEHESDKDIQNVFKALELSATRNLMLLECEIVRDPDMKFTCSLSLQGRALASRTHATKNGSKRLCSEAVMNEMKKKHDYIYVTTNFIGHTITKNELIERAIGKKANGDPPAKIFYKRQEAKADVKADTLEAKLKQEEDKRRNEHIENLPENVHIKPLLPWMAAAMYEIIDDYYQEITLEDLMVNVSEMTKSQRDMVTACASKMGLRVITKLKTQHDSSLLRRTVTAQDMSKILQLHGGESGRYKLIKCVNPCSEEELRTFKNESLRQHQLLVDARNNDDPDAEEPEEQPKDRFPPPPAAQLASPEEKSSETENNIDDAANPGDSNDLPKSTPPDVKPLMASLLPLPRGFRPPRPQFGSRFPPFGPSRMFRPRFHPF